MKVITAKQLKQRTGEIIRMVRAGERFTLTHRGKPVAIIEPSSEKFSQFQARPFEEAWKDIEAALAETVPRFSNWREATRWMRGRS